MSEDNEHIPDAIYKYFDELYADISIVLETMVSEMSDEEIERTKNLMDTKYMKDTFERIIKQIKG